MCVCFLGFISVWLATNYSEPMALIALQMHFYRAACIFPSSKLQFMWKLVGYSEPSSSAFSLLSLLPLFYRNEASRNCILFIVWNWQTDLKIKLEKKNWRCRNFIRPIWWIHWFDFGTIGKGNKKTRKDSQITVLGSISKFIKTPEKYSWNTHSHTRSLHYTNKLD